MNWRNSFDTVTLCIPGPERTLSSRFFPSRPSTDLSIKTRQRTDADPSPCHADDGSRPARWTEPTDLFFYDTASCC
ncbi:hypothetical protein RJ55_05658 [Drechmeria coniospora]|nr:hypothetical protein RJ55_05658 [Drechmeria coniospora]